MPASPYIADSSEKKKLVAPLWHTIILVLVILALALVQTRQQNQLGSIHLKSRLPLYAGQIVFELILVAYVWLLGLRLTGTPLRELIGGKWDNARDVARDIGVALAFWLAVAAVLVVLNKLLGENAGGLAAVKGLLPQGPIEMAAWVVLCVTAGFCEELVFRGYLQRQFLALTGSAGMAIPLQALVFGAGHGYQGMKGIVVITIYGAMFGILAMMRKSLRPGMIQHAGQDIFSGIVGSVLAKRHLF